MDQKMNIAEVFKIASAPDQKAALSNDKEKLDDCLGAIDGAVRQAATLINQFKERGPEDEGAIADVYAVMPLVQTMLCSKMICGDTGNPALAIASAMASLTIARDEGMAAFASALFTNAFMLGVYYNHYVMNSTEDGVDLTK